MGEDQKWSHELMNEIHGNTMEIGSDKSERNIGQGADQGISPSEARYISTVFQKVYFYCISKLDPPLKTFLIHRPHRTEHSVEMIVFMLNQF
jgi:hypothetical protein